MASDQVLCEIFTKGLLIELQRGGDGSALGGASAVLCKPMLLSRGGCVADAHAPPEPPLPRPSAVLQPPLSPTVPLGTGRTGRSSSVGRGPAVYIAPEQGLQQLRHAPAPRMAAGPGRWQQQRGWAGVPALLAIAPPASLSQGLLSLTPEAETTIMTPVHPRPPPFFPCQLHCCAPWWAPR
jgi:hypothetical protein